MKIVYKKNALSNTVPEMQGATSSAAGSSGLVPTPLAADAEKFLKGDGTWAENKSSSNFTGTLEQWNNLTQAEQEEYDTVDLEDDYNGWPVDNVPTENSNNLVKSGGVYSAIASIPTPTSDTPVDKTTTFNADGSITEEFDTHTVETTFNADGSITEVYTYTSGNVITKTTTFSGNEINEVVTTS